MTARQKKKPVGGKKGQPGEIQARQADDGSFELMVETAATSASSEPVDDGVTVGAGADTGRSRKRDVRRLRLLIVIGLVAVGVLGYMLSDDDGVTPAEEEPGSESAFRPYLNAPDRESSSAPSPPDTPRSDQAEDDSPGEAQRASSLDSGPSDEEEDWAEKEGDSEVVVLEEEHPAEEYDEGAEAEPDKIDEEATAKPAAEVSPENRVRQRVKLPTRTPKMKHLSKPQLDKLRPSIPDFQDEKASRGNSRSGGGNRREHRDNDAEDESFGDGRVEEGAPAEYHDEGGGFDDGRQGY